jgi:hypothetical protein
VRPSPAIKDVNRVAEVDTELEAVTRQRLLKTQQTKNVVNCGMCELEIAL